MKTQALFLLLFVIVFTNCKNDDETPVDTCIQGFDQQAMFQNIASNIILPAYADLQEKVNTLQNTSNAFGTAPTLDKLQTAQEAFSAAYLSWQNVAQFEFGPAEEVFLRNSLNNFPVNVSAVMANISSGTYDFSLPDNFDKGFPALDYLLFGLADTNADMVDKYLNDTSGSQLISYLEALTKDIKDRVDHTHNGWTTTYQKTFTENTGTAAGSSLSLIINGLNHNFELIKREKIGFPSGVLTSGFTNPEAVEAVYSGLSLDLAKAAIQATEQLYLGNSFTGTDGLGLGDYLVKVSAQVDGQSLHTVTQAQFTKIQNALDALSDPLPLSIDNNLEVVLDLYREVAQQLPNTKTSMPSVLCVSITYIDNPSDSD